MRPPSATIRLLLLMAWSGLLVAGAPAKTPAPSPAWEALATGLELGTFAGPCPSSHGDSTITVLRVDPAAFELKLLNASAPGEGESRTVRSWVTRAGAVAGINASMFHHGGESVSLMRTRTHVNNAKLTKDRGASSSCTRGRRIPCTTSSSACVRFNENDDNVAAWPVPNVVVIVPKA